MKYNSKNVESKDHKLKLRKIAEDKLQAKEEALSDNIGNVDSEYVERSVHELKVHQIELEMQLNELQKVQTELDISLNKYFDLYDQAPVGYLTLTQEGIVVEANLTASRLLGKDRIDLLEKPFSRCIIEEDQDVFYHCRRLIGKTREHQECELRMLGPENFPFWALLSTVLNNDENGELHFRVAISDITERKNTEEELIKADKRAQAANEAKSQFLANMGHEIRTPLNGLMGMTQLLAATELDEEQKELIAHLEISSAALLSVITDILDYSKIEAGKMKMEDIPFKPEKILQETVNFFRISAAEKGLTLETVTDDEIPLLRGDPFRLRQVLSNLIGNAVKYTPNGKIQVKLDKIQTSDEKVVKLKCSVNDTGIGIDPEKIPLIFDRFSQGDSSNARQHGGSGLGLSICKGLVDKMGGEIWADSTPGAGSRFVFTCRMKLADDKSMYISQDAK